jgi:hypothetical protein
MKTVITELYTNLTDEQLREAILQMKEDEPLGIIRTDGWVRKLTKQVCDITGETNISTHFFLTQNSLFREAAYRFVK